MGSRGASSGISDKGNDYGTQYEEIHEEGNIKFIKKRTRQSEDLLETMTRGRIYVTVGGKQLLAITYFDDNNKRSKVLHLDHAHEGVQPHEHDGYYPVTVNGKKQFRRPNADEQAMIDRVVEIWNNILESGYKPR